MIKRVLLVYKDNDWSLGPNNMKESRGVRREDLTVDILQSLWQGLQSLGAPESVQFGDPTQRWDADKGDTERKTYKSDSQVR